MGRPGPRALRAAARPAHARPLTRAAPSRNRQQPGQAGSNKLPPNRTAASGHWPGPVIRLTPAGSTDKQGSPLLRWVLCEAAQTAKRSPQFAAGYQAIATRRGKKIATTAVARKLLTRAWHLLTDAEHAAATQPAAASAPQAGTR